jgi:hypothetical protein
MILSVVYPSALSTAATIGLLIAFGTPAALCALAAVLLWAVTRLPQAPGLLDAEYERQAEDLKWAMRFGAEIADAFKAGPPGSARGR